ncbi:hypothetical protein AWM75_07985 [Aerococcus urinaehominis]|uniref:Uncharacterized protein n=1 Tax=Aerococcus urinaehominis TaxID=128944 RepID=A0A109RI41_9LACT|nr:hypothetical protein [Aerococcus urinaehominis]AMB99911.1 hypothetical protein AWM75_07985 [Aerococcus urinaehominis]SDM52046.1 hypothetical protein SAMN04487985_1212 [Aerococcus urinaehominis]
MSLKLQAIGPNDRVLVLCEGPSEKVVMEMLLEQDRLPFSKHQLLEGEFITIGKNIKKLQQAYLSFQFSYPLHIFSVQDSKNDLWLNKLASAYQSKAVQIAHVVTAPEIEMLMVHALGKQDDFFKSKSKTKPSTFIKQVVGENPKTEEFIRDFYCQYSLVDAIKIQKSKAQDSHKYCFLADLINL